MDERQRGRLQELRAELEQVRQKKHKSFDDLNKLVQKVYRSFPEDFPDRTVTKRGSRVVYHSNAPGVYPISKENTAHVNMYRLVMPSLRSTESNPCLIT